MIARKHTSLTKDKSQKHLEPIEDKNNVDKLVSLAFDENPKIRLRVAQQLSDIDDPRAMLALLELSSDEDQEVKDCARKGLGTYKEEDEAAFSNLEKFFTIEQKQEAPIKDMEAAKKKLMPSLERFFSQSSKEKLMPSLEKIFQHSLSDEKQTQYAESQKTDKKEQKTDSSDVLSDIESIQHPSERQIIQSAEDEVGVPARLQNPDKLRQKRQGQQPTDSDLEAATNFPLPEHLAKKLYSPVSGIPMMGDTVIPQEIADEEERLPISRLDYYKWAYALAVTPSIKASDLKKEKTRLIKEAKKSIELAFKFAIARAKQDGVENLSLIKPGMRRLTTLPLEVLDVNLTKVPRTKTLDSEYTRVMLSDGKTSVPLYVEPKRASGIRVGDLVSIREANVVYMQTDRETNKGEVAFQLGKRGQLIITK